MSHRDLVVIGGSLGSMEPLKTVLSSLPADFPAAILIVIHVPANSTGIFATVSAASTVLPLKTAEDGETIEIGRVYLAPPNRHLLIDNGKLKLGFGPRENMVRPAIDPLFRSAALSHGSRAIGVILSGMLNDGASGLATIKKAGGIALVQAPADSTASEMPLAALEATAVNLSAPAAELAAALVRYAGQPAGPAVHVPDEVKLEVSIAAGRSVTTEQVATFAKPSVLTCPDCGGGLSEVVGSHPLRFRCQVGHGYTGKALLMDQEDSVDEAMRVALRIIEERASLVNRMSRDAEQTNRLSVAEMYAERAAEYRSYAEVLRTAIIGSMAAEKTVEEAAEVIDFSEEPPKR